MCVRVRGHGVEGSGFSEAGRQAGERPGWLHKTRQDRTGQARQRACGLVVWAGWLAGCSLTHARAAGRDPAWGAWAAGELGGFAVFRDLLPYTVPTLLYRGGRGWHGHGHGYGRWKQWWQRGEQVNSAFPLRSGVAGASVGGEDVATKARAAQTANGWVLPIDSCLTLAPAGWRGWLAWAWFIEGPIDEY